MKEYKKLNHNHLWRSIMSAHAGAVSDLTYQLFSKLSHSPSFGLIDLQIALAFPKMSSLK